MQVQNSIAPLAGPHIEFAVSVWVGAVGYTSAVAQRGIGAALNKREGKLLRLVLFGTIASAGALSAAAQGGPVVGAVVFGGAILSGAAAVLGFFKKS